MTDSWGSFRVEQRDLVTILTLDTGLPGNSYNASFWREFGDYLEALKSDPTCRALCITSAGRHFGAGMNLEYLAKVNAGRSGDVARYNHWVKDLVLYLQGVIARIEALDIPVIAMASGACIGGSLAIFSACDLRLADESAFFSIHEINVGIMCDLGTIQRIGRLCGEAFAAELAYIGDAVSCERAMRGQLLARSFADRDTLLAEGIAMAERLATRSPLALSGVKNTLRSMRESHFSESLKTSAIWNGAMYTSEDVGKAIAAQRDRQSTQFENQLRGIPR